MVNGYSFLFVFIFSWSFVKAQFGSVDVNFDDQLLRSDEKQIILPLQDDIRRFFLNTTWVESYSDLQIPLHIHFVFEGVTAKGNERMFNLQALISNGRDLRFFDKNIRFYYNSGTSLYFDPVLFEPLSGFLAYYGYLILAGEIDTYEPNGGNNAYEMARGIAQSGIASEYNKGWLDRKLNVDDLTRNLGLRKARLAWYIALDLFKEGDMEGTLEELDNMLDGIDQSFKDIGRDNNTQYFLKVYSDEIIMIMAMLGRREMLKDMRELDPDRRETYQTALDSISK